jgi:hypothetical protein
VISESPFVQSPANTFTPAALNASRTGWRSIAAASLTLHVRHQSAVK